MSESTGDVRSLLDAAPSSIFRVPPVRHALEGERGLTTKALAKKLGVSDKTINNWRGRTQPQPHHVRRLAEALSIDLVRVYQALGWLEPGSATSMEARDGRALAESTVRLLRAVGTGVPGGAPAVLRRALQLRHEAFSWTDMRTVDGSVAVELRDFVGLTEPGAARDGRPDDAAAARLRATYELAMRLGPALLEDREEVIELCQQRHRAQAWFWVPRLVATKPRREAKPVRRTLRQLELPDGVTRVVVVGNRLTGADRVAALLAREAGWGHLNTSIEAQRVFGREAERQRRHTQRALWVGEAVLHTDLGDGHVIGHGASATAATLIENAAQRASSTLLVCLTAEPQLVHFARRATLGQADTVLDERGEVADFGEGILAAFEAAVADRRDEWVVPPVRIRVDADVLTVPASARDRSQRLVSNESHLWAAHARAYRTLAEQLTRRPRGGRPDGPQG